MLGNVSPCTSVYFLSAEVRTINVNYFFFRDFCVNMKRVGDGEGVLSLLEYFIKISFVEEKL